MRIKPFSNFRVIAYCIFGFGILLDSYSVYGLWKQLNDTEGLQVLLADNGLPLEASELQPLIELTQNLFNGLLVMFLVWDYVAYFFFLKHKDWARKYVISIALCYLISLTWEFSIAYAVYALFTLYYLWGQKKAFS